MQTATLIIGWYDANVTFIFKSPPKKKGLKTKKLHVHKLHDPKVKSNLQTEKQQVHKLHDPHVKNNLQVLLEERLHCATAAETEEQWKQMKTIPQETTVEVVGLSTRKHRLFS